MKFINLLLTSATLLAPVATFAQTARFEYRIRNVPVTEQNCPATAQNIAARFTSVTERPVVSAYCQKQISRFLDIIITYSGDFELKLVSTIDPFESDQGMYVTAAECEANRNSETQKFRQHTGLEPIVAFCYANYTDLKLYPHPYAIRIEGFGKPKMWPITDKWSFFNTPDIDQNTIASIVKSRAMQLGIIEPSVVFDYTFVSYRLMMKYYSPTIMSRPLSVVQFTTYETLAQCQSRRNEVYGVLSKAEAIPLVTLCAVDRFSYLAPMSSLVFTRGAYGSEMVGGAYESMAACDQERERVKDIYSSSFGRDVIDALCSHQNSDSAYRKGVYMRIFFRT